MARLLALGGLRLARAQQHRCAPGVRRFRRSITCTANKQGGGEDGARNSPPTGVVWTTKCTNPYANLALEDWVYDHLPLGPNAANLSGRTVLFLWRNDPVVVVGRNQHPFVECNLQEMQRRGVSLARRRSGGGTVYHDHGNLNCTFFTSRELHDKVGNSELMADALLAGCNIKAKLNSRNDLAVLGHKVSGSAYKLGNRAAYHHCTLLLDVNEENLHACLKPTPLSGTLTSKGVKSERSPIVNLRQHSQLVNYDTVCDAIGEQFLSRCDATVQGPSVIEIDPTDETLFPGIAAYREELESYDWKFGCTPPFEYTAKEDFDWGKVDVTFRGRKGLFTEAAFVVTTATEQTFLQGLLDEVSNRLIHQPYTMASVDKAFGPSLASTQTSNMVDQTRLRLHAAVFDSATAA